MNSYAVDVSLLCKAFFTLASVSSVAGLLAPSSFRTEIMNYGSRGTAAIAASQNAAREELAGAEPPSKDSKEALSKQPFSIFGAISSLQVPHAWFTYFYVASAASSIFWAHQILTRGVVFRFLLSQHAQISQSSSANEGISGMTVNQAVLAWTFMALQGARRLYESIALGKPSKAKMWVGLWVIGVAYYIFMGIAVWIEGIDALSEIESPMDLINLLDISKPSRKSFIAVPIFILATGIQHDCHVYLTSLKKYTLPDQELFRVVLCPHYTAECFVYLAIAIIAAPQGRLLNGTVLSGMGFVVTNLAVTADSTRKWYAEKFGAEKIKGRWRMVPYVY